MRQDVFGDTLTALRSARTSGILSAGAFGGVKRPPMQAGKYYLPHWAMSGTGAVTLTANRLYRAWIYFDDQVTLAGGFFKNSGTTDAGKNVRMGIWDASGNLKKDFGAVALDGTSALRSLANAVTLAAGWYQVGLVSDSTPAIFGMRVTGGADGSAPLTQGFGLFGGPVFTAIGYQTYPLGDYAAFAYAAMPDPITAATASINDNGAGNQFPLMGVYL